METYDQDAVMTQAKCPRCEKLHFTKVNWIGENMPRIYCTSCKKYISNKNLSFCTITRSNPKRGAE